MKIWLPITIVISALVVTLGSIVFLNKRPPLNKTASPSPANQSSSSLETAPEIARVNLTLKPETPEIKTGETGSYLVVLDTGSFATSAIQSQFIYDPQLITITSVTPGNFFTQPEEIENTIDAQKGEIRYTLITLNRIQGNDAVIKITYIALVPIHASSVIRFNQSGTMVAVTDVAKNRSYAKAETQVNFTEQPLTILP